MECPRCHGTGRVGYRLSRQDVLRVLRGVPRTVFETAARLNYPKQPVKALMLKMLKDNQVTRHKDGGVYLWSPKEDGDCAWEGCPQLRDGEPEATGRHCPLDSDSEVP